MSCPRKAPRPTGGVRAPEGHRGSGRVCPLGQRTAAPALRKHVSLRPEAVAGRGPRPDGDLRQKRTQDGAGSWAPLLRADPAEAPSNAGVAGNAIKESGPRTKGPQSSMAGLLASWSSPLPPRPPPPFLSGTTLVPMDRLLLTSPSSGSRPPAAWGGGGGGSRSAPHMPQQQSGAPFLKTAASPPGVGVGLGTSWEPKAQRSRTRHLSRPCASDQGVERAEAGTPKAV